MTSTLFRVAVFNLTLLGGFNPNGDKPDALESGAGNIIGELDKFDGQLKNDPWCWEQARVEFLAELLGIARFCRRLVLVNQ